MKSSERALHLATERPGTTGEPECQLQSSNVRKLRIYARRKVIIHALAKWQSAFVPIEVRNISRGGAGLRIQACIAAGIPLVVAMPSGRQISGRVRWSRQGFCGIEFEQPLSHDDELLGESEPHEPMGADFAAASIVAFPVSGPSGGVKDTARGVRAAGRGLLQTALEGLQKVCRTSGRRRRETLMEKACRKQGFSWLID